MISDEEELAPGINWIWTPSSNYKHSNRIGVTLHFDKLVPVTGELLATETAKELLDKLAKEMQKAGYRSIASPEVVIEPTDTCYLVDIEFDTPHNFRRTAADSAVSFHERIKEKVLPDIQNAIADMELNDPNAFLDRVCRNRRTQLFDMLTDILQEDRWQSVTFSEAKVTLQDAICTKLENAGMHANKRLMGEKLNDISFNGEELINQLAPQIIARLVKALAPAQKK